MMDDRDSYDTLDCDLLPNGTDADEQKVSKWSALLLMTSFDAECMRAESIHVVLDERIREIKTFCDCLSVLPLEADAEWSKAFEEVSAIPV